MMLGCPSSTKRNFGTTAGFFSVGVESAGAHFVGFTERLLNIWGKYDLHG